MSDQTKNIGEQSLEIHRKLRGKIGIHMKDPLMTQESIGIFYTPGMATVSQRIADHPKEARELTGLNNSVAIVSDGSAVLGLGDIGPHAALPVMEGKSMLFKRFAGIDCYPVVLGTKNVDEIVAAVKNISPSFGAINLEDISAPRCFEIEDRLKNELDIPVMHDDQHGTAIVVLAGLINSMKVVNKNLNDCSLVVSGVGAAGVAIMKLLKLYAASLTIIACDSRGVINSDRNDLNSTKQKLLSKGIITSDNPGTLSDVIQQADIFVGVSQPNVLTHDMVKSMNPRAVIFALANPNPEIMPDEAKNAGAAIVATGRSDFPNQVNNALAFPGIFRGALDNRVNKITDEHKIAAAKVIADIVENPSADEIIPSIFVDGLANKIAGVIK